MVDCHCGNHKRTKILQDQHNNGTPSPLLKILPYRRNGAIFIININIFRTCEPFLSCTKVKRCGYLAMTAFIAGKMVTTYADATFADNIDTLGIATFGLNYISRSLYHWEQMNDVDLETKKMLVSTEETNLTKCDWPNHNTVDGCCVSRESCWSWHVNYVGCIGALAVCCRKGFRRYYMIGKSNSADLHSTVRSDSFEW